MQQGYNIYYCGELAPGHDEAQVRPRLAKLFGASEATLDKLFSGSPQLLKRECDKATALKYKQAMEQAGARPRIRRAADGPPQVEPPTAAPATQPAAAQPTMAQPTMAERVAALAAAPTKQAAPSAEEADTGPYSLAPPGAELLQPGERQDPQRVEVDTSHLDLGEPGPLPNLARPEPPPPPPPVSNLSLEETGELIPNLPADLPPVAPDITDIELCGGELDLSDCAPPPAAAPALDLSALDLSPPGSPVLEPRYRRRDSAAAPSTDHLSLQSPPAD